MPFENLLVETQERIARVTLNRPHKLNALNRATIGELGACCEQLAGDPGVGVVILTGAGEKAFVAGADINELASQTPIEGKQYGLAGQAVLNRIENLGKPVIAAVNGYALGGGCELAMACTLRIASVNARFGQPEVKLGIIPGYGGTQRLPRLVGTGRALQLLLTGEQIQADEALRIGLVNEVVAAAELLPRCEAIARLILANAPIAVRLATEAVYRGLHVPLADGLYLEATLFGLACATEDMKEGTRAFLEKRSARFTGT